MSSNSRCPCSSCQESEFQRIADLKNIGLAIYRHVRRNVNGDPTREKNTDNDTYIFYNCKDIDIASAAFVPEFDKNKTSCPRCRYIFRLQQSFKHLTDHSTQKKLVQNVQVIEKNDIVGKCNQCRTRPRPFVCQRCEESVKRFVIDLRLNIWLREVNNRQNTAIGSNLNSSTQILHPTTSRPYTDVNSDIKDRTALSYFLNSKNTENSLAKDGANAQRVFNEQHSDKTSKADNPEAVLISSLTNTNKLAIKFDDHNNREFLFEENLLKDATKKSNNLQVEKEMNDRSDGKFEMFKNQTLKDRKIDVQKKIHKPTNIVESNYRKKQNVFEDNALIAIKREKVNSKDGDKASTSKKDKKRELQKDQLFSNKTIHNLQKDKTQKQSNKKIKTETDNYNLITAKNEKQKRYVQEDGKIAVNKSKTKLAIENSLQNNNSAKKKSGKLLSPESKNAESKIIQESNLEITIKEEQRKIKNEAILSRKSGKNLDKENSMQSKKAKSSSVKFNKTTRQIIEENNLDSGLKEDQVNIRDKQKRNTKTGENLAETDGTDKNNNEKQSKGKKNKIKSVQETHLKFSLDKQTKNKNNKKIKTENYVTSGEVKTSRGQSEKVAEKSDTSRDKNNKNDFKTKKANITEITKNRVEKQNNTLDTKITRPTPQNKKELKNFKIENEDVSKVLKKNGTMSRTPNSLKGTHTFKMETEQYLKLNSRDYKNAVSSTSRREQRNRDKKTADIIYKLGKPISFSPQFPKDNFHNTERQLVAKSKRNQQSIKSCEKALGGRNKPAKSFEKVGRETCKTRYKNEFAISDVNEMKSLKKILNEVLGGQPKELHNTNRKQQPCNKATSIIIEKLQIVIKHLNHKTVVPNCIICADSDTNLNLEEWKTLKCIRRVIKGTMCSPYRCICRSFKGSEFHKVTELRDIGLAVFRHVQRNINEDPRRFTNAENDTYIFYNCKDIDITSAAFVPEFSKNKKSCPRCFYIVEHTQQLLHNVPIIEKNDIVGICDHCRTKSRSFACQRCEESVKRFVIDLRLNIWLRKIQSVQNIENGKNVRDTEQILCSKVSRSHTDFNIKMPPVKNTQPTLTKSCSCENLQTLTKKRHSGRLSKTYSEESLIESLSSIDKIRKKFDNQNKFGYLFPGSILKEPIGKSKHNKKNEIVRGQPITEFKLDHIPNIEENISDTTIVLKGKKYGQVKSPKPNDLKKQNIAREGIPKHGRPNENLSKENNDKDESRNVRGKPKKNTLLTKSERNEKLRVIEQDKEKAKAVKDNDISMKNKSLIKKHIQPKLKIEMDDMPKGHRIEENHLKLRTGYHTKNKLNPNTKIEEKCEEKDNSAKNKIDKPLNHELAEKSKNDVKKSIQINDINISLKEDRTRNKNKQKLNEVNGQSPENAKHEIDKSEKNMRKQDVSIAEDKKQKPIKEGPTSDSKKGDKNQTNKTFETKKDHSSPRKQKEAVSVEIVDKKATQMKKKNGEESKKVVSSKITLTPKKDAEQFQKPGTSTSLKNKTNEVSSGRKIGGRNQSSNSFSNVSQETCFRNNKFSNSDDNDMKRLREFFDQKLKSVNKDFSVPAFIENMPIVVKHLKHKTIVPNCIICADFDVNLNLEELMNEKYFAPEEYKYIKGERVFKAKAPRNVLKAADLELNSPEKNPTLFKSFYTIQNEDKSESEHTENSSITTLNAKEPAKEDGVIKYALSDRQFIEKGWTVLPVEKIVSKEFTFGMRPAHPEFDWFKYNKNKGYMQYDTGDKLADFDDKGRGRWFYKNGRIALDYYDSEELNGKQRIVIYSSGELDRRGRSYPITILATFDYAGNGIVFDHGGKIRLKYNQKTGVVLDRQIGPVSRWKWHSLTEPLELKRVMMDTHLNDPDIMKLGGKNGDANDSEKKRKTEDTDVLAVEFDNYMKEKHKLLDHELRPYQIKTKAFKINEQFSLRIMDQANIHIIFRDHIKQLRLNIGMILDNQDIKDIDTLDVGRVLNTVEQYPAKSGSIEEMQIVLANARRCELANAERQRLLLPAVDRVNAPVGSGSLSGLTSSLWPPPQTETSLFSSNTYNKSKKSLTKNTYYNTRFI